MHWFIRSLIFWIVCAPLFYVFGMPWLMTKLETKARADNYVACQQHLKDEHLGGVPAALLSPKQADDYCHCVSDSITLTKADLFDLVRKKQPARLEAAMKPIVENCNTTLQNTLNHAINGGSGPTSTFDPNGTETVHFN